MREKILSDLRNFEKMRGVTVILAVESGSRGWGFASEDSDYDVRFVYKYPSERYLHLNRPRDCHDWIDGKVDYEGFDVYKFYDLLWKSNQNIIDWLFQDNIYLDKLQKKKELQEVVSLYFSRKTYIAHNYGLCKKNFHKYFVAPAENEPTAKRYVYCLRSLLSAQYCAENDKIAPLNFYDVIEATLKDKEAEEVREMVEIKKKTKERVWYRNDKWSDWIKAKLEAEHPRRVDRYSHEEYYKMLNPLLLNEVMK